MGGARVVISLMWIQFDGFSPYKPTFCSESGLEAANCYEVTSYRCPDTGQSVTTKVLYSGGIIIIAQASFWWEKDANFLSMSNSLLLSIAFMLLLYP